MDQIVKGRAGTAKGLHGDGNRFRRNAVRLGAVLLTTQSSACVADASRAPAEVGICRPCAARALVGIVAPGDPEILRRTAATTLRRIAPGDPTTRDFRRERVTVTVDETGRIVAASCG